MAGRVDRKVKDITQASTGSGTNVSSHNLALNLVNIIIIILQVEKPLHKSSLSASYGPGLVTLGWSPSLA